jgi:hypothetical protein
MAIREEIDAYKRKAEANLSQFDADVRKWGAQGKEKEADAELNALHARRTDFVDRVREADRVGDDKWDDFRRDMDNKWESLKSDFKRMTSK